MSTASDATGSAALVGPLYCDASALAKLFLPEPESGELNARIAGRDDVLISDLAITEVASALARRAREGALAVPDARRVHGKILSTVSDGSFRRLDIVPATHREAERLLLASDRVALRAADALHLALALRASAGTVLTFDRILARAALAQGLGAFPPTAS